MTAEVDNNTSTTGESAFMDSGDTDSEPSTESDVILFVGSGIAAIQTEGIVYTEKELEDRLSNLEQHLKELQSCNEQLLVKQAELESQNDCFKQQVEEFKDDREQLREQLKGNHKEFKTREEELEAQVKKLEAQVKQLQTQVKQLQMQLQTESRKLAENEDKLYLSQVAVEFERAICYHVIPEVYSKDKNASSANIKALLNMLNCSDGGYILLDREEYTDPEIEDILKEAHVRWEGICDTLKLPPNWKKITGKNIDLKNNSSPEIFRAMNLLKHKRNFIAHPTPVSLHEAEKKVKTPLIKESYVTLEFKVVKKFIESGLRESIQASGIKIDKKRLKLD